ncbi:MAG: FkbM family methyltransferase [Chitinophagaceae bacterium]|jgi:FkbM family methyltransferase
MPLKDFIIRTAKKMGIAIRRYPVPEYKRLSKIFQYFDIDLLVDVGANTGQYAQLVRELQYKKQIVSFEPVKAAFEQLQKKSNADSLWEVHQTALASNTGASQIHVSANSFSSSILQMLPAHLDAAPNSGYTNTEIINLTTLDVFLKNYQHLPQNIFLKIDTQGYEWEVLKGAEEYLPRITCLQLELSLTPLYQNEKTYGELMDYLIIKGFELYTLEPGFYNKDTGRLLQVDAIFVNKELLKK